MPRRRMLQASVALTSFLLTSPLRARTALPLKSAWYQPEEGIPHQRTWMAFGATDKVWGAALLPEVQKALANVAKAIARFEPVLMLVREAEYEFASNLCGPSVDLTICPIDDIWMRDMGPSFLVDARGNRAGVAFRFNGWGGKLAHERDAKVADFVIAQSGVTSLRSGLTIEGGAVEVDGRGTAIVSESSVLNPNRNPRLRRNDIEAELKALLGLRKIIWLPGSISSDIANGHADQYARFAAPGQVVLDYDPKPGTDGFALSQQHLAILKEATDADGRDLNLYVIDAPKSVRTRFQGRNFHAGYLGYYVANRAVIMPEFGDARADGLARETLRKLYPGREIVQVDIDAIAAGGGSIHGLALQEPE